MTSPDSSATPSRSPGPSSSAPLRILWLLTKNPWPSTDGGRLLVANTLSALDPESLRVTLAGPWHEHESQQNQAEAVASVVGLGSPSGPTAWARLKAGLSNSVPLTALQHGGPDVRRRVASLLRDGCFDAVHLEQPHAFGMLPRSSPPVLLRSQNVEFDLWTQYAATRPWPIRLLFERQARAVQRWELDVANSAALVAAISDQDRLLLEKSGVAPDKLVTLKPAFSNTLPGSAISLQGDPALLLFAGSSWRPNQVGERRFLFQHWPRLSSANPGARLHVFSSSTDFPGPAIPNATHHLFPNDAESAFVPGAILVVPALVTSGVRMKILEAWARGVAVLSTPAGAKGLGTEGESVVAIADSSEEWASQLQRLSSSEERRQQVRSGRRLLTEANNPEHVARQLEGLYRRISVQESS